MSKFILLSLLCFSANFAYATKHKITGENIFKNNCTNCHWHQTDTIFINKKKGLKTKRNLANMVSKCITSTNVGIFPEEEKKIVDYLNNKFYHFK